MNRLYWQEYRSLGINIAFYRKKQVIPNDSLRSCWI